MAGRSGVGSSVLVVQYVESVWSSISIVSGGRGSERESDGKLVGESRGWIGGFTSVGRVSAMGIVEELFLFYYLGRTSSWDQSKFWLVAEKKRNAGWSPPNV